MSLDSTHVSPQTPSEVMAPVMGPLRRHTHTYDLMRQCIHCGFCLPTCPTYAVLGVEMDSPRGRIYQMQAVAEGRLAVNEDFVEHMYCCLGCRACETACPSGVQFGKLIEAAREQIQIEAASTTMDQEQVHPADEYPVTEKSMESLAGTLLRRFFFDVMLPSRLITTLVFSGLKIYQRSGLQALVRRLGLLDMVDALPTPFQGKLKQPEALMEQAGGDIVPMPLPEITEAHGERRYRVGFISGCIMDQVFRDINEATLRVLAANGCEVITPPQQQCCGALHVHAGEAERGRQLARQNIDVFEPYQCDAIIINSAGCGSNLKEYGHLLRDDAEYAERATAFSDKVKDISEFLVSIELNTQMGEVKRKVAYHDACHLAHGQKIRQQPRELLKGIPGIELRTLKEADWCCGSAGIYNITNQEMAGELLERKMGHIDACGADVIATGNPGCMLQIAKGARERDMAVEVIHPVQLLDEAYQAGGAYEVNVRDTGFKKEAVLLGLVVGVALGFAFVRRRMRAKK